MFSGARWALAAAEMVLLISTDLAVSFPRERLERELAPVSIFSVERFRCHLNFLSNNPRFREQLLLLTSLRWAVS